MVFRFINGLKGFVLIVFLIFTILLVIPCFSSSLQLRGSGDSFVWSKWFRAYEMVVELSRVGMNVSSYLPGLQKAYNYLEKGDFDSAEKVLDEIMLGLTSLYGEKDSFVFWNNFRKIMFAVLIGSFPVLFYYFFPRVYLWVWFKTREKWVIER